MFELSYEDGSPAGKVVKIAHKDLGHTVLNRCAAHALLCGPKLTPTRPCRALQNQQACQHRAHACSQPQHFEDAKRAQGARSLPAALVLLCSIFIGMEREWEVGVQVRAGGSRGRLGRNYTAAVTAAWGCYCWCSSLAAANGSLPLKQRDVCCASPSPGRAADVPAWAWALPAAARGSGGGGRAAPGVHARVRLRGASRGGVQGAVLGDDHGEDQRCAALRFERLVLCCAVGGMLCCGVLRVCCGQTCQSCLCYTRASAGASLEPVATSVSSPLDHHPTHAGWEVYKRIDTPEFHNIHYIRQEGARRSVTRARGIEIDTHGRGA